MEKNKDVDKPLESFECSQCQNKYKYDKFSKYKDEKSKFYILEDVYYIKDPFAHKSFIPLVLGGICSLCMKAVCVDQKCSIFYTKRYCLTCVQENIESFPKEVL